VVEALRAKPTVDQCYSLTSPCTLSMAISSSMMVEAFYRVVAPGGQNVVEASRRTFTTGPRPFPFHMGGG
jgi:hypothetical protein